MKKDRIKEICKEAFKELIAENLNEVRGLLEEESLKKYKNGDDYAKNVTIRIKSEGVVKDCIPESIQEYLDMKGLNSTFKGMSEYSDKLIILDKLLDIRDIYRQGWEPNWRNANYEKNNIYFYENRINLDVSYGTMEIFSFQSEEIRDRFYRNFKNELEEVKELWS